MGFERRYQFSSGTGTELIGMYDVAARPRGFVDGVRIPSQSQKENEWFTFIG